jgi:hypothetical protein
MSLLNGQEACKIKTIENQEIIAGNNSITA